MMPSVGRTLLRLSRLHRVLPVGVRRRVFGAGYLTREDQLNVGWVPGTVMIVRPAAVSEVGPLREELFMYGEDLEWCWRMRRAGWRIGVCSSATFVHDTSSSARVTFDDDEVRRRIAEGTDAACRLMYGARHARVLAGLTAVSFAIDARAPGKSPAQRDRARSSARVWRRSGSEAIGVATKLSARGGARTLPTIASAAAHPRRADAYGHMPRSRSSAAVSSSGRSASACARTVPRAASSRACRGVPARVAPTGAIAAS